MKYQEEQSNGSNEELVLDHLKRWRMDSVKMTKTWVQNGFTSLMQTSSRWCQWSRRAHALHCTASVRFLEHCRLQLPMYLCVHRGMCGLISQLTDNIAAHSSAERFTRNNIGVVVSFVQTNFTFLILTLPCPICCHTVALRRHWNCM